MLSSPEAQSQLILAEPAHSPQLKRQSHEYSPRYGSSMHLCDRAGRILGASELLHLVRFLVFALRGQCVHQLPACASAPPIKFRAAQHAGNVLNLMLADARARDTALKSPPHPSAAARLNFDLIFGLPASGARRPTRSHARQQRSPRSPRASYFYSIFVLPASGGTREPRPRSSPHAHPSSRLFIRFSCVLRAAIHVPCCPGLTRSSPGIPTPVFALPPPATRRFDRRRSDAPTNFNPDAPTRPALLIRYFAAATWPL
ncbi:hypothetical protein B0H15DRAFT_999004 [Mycena belliarum]|uniref:Uncharacterized protein n=1 Tax=Mycena belliarum TaxID=1033014 RepID=A0AAD6UDR5_9AGAR|nr:hypothetical protein B0H15DRAFT_999004 [Mycena belliae]